MIQKVNKELNEMKIGDQIPKLGCRIKANCPFVKPGFTQGECPPCGTFLEMLARITQVKEKTTKN